ncbi:hypothetical protein C8R46DRAFT_1113791 [Mycena filopes]|nr:hypothetical protein C8R46DRAFT_1113791 [Mycena filopes]
MLAANLALRAQLAEIDASIAELNLRLRALERARWPIESELDRIVYPVLSLPPEITAEIFLRCLPHARAPSVESGFERIRPNPQRAPLLLLQVCGTWREIALSTPRLWDCLYLYDSTFEEGYSLNAVTKVITDWFGRAGSSPLTLSLEISETQKRRLEADAVVLSTILSPLAPRLKKLWIELDRADELADVGPFPILETLAIYYDPMEDTGPPLNLFSVAPRLGHLVFVEYTDLSMFILPQAISKVTCGNYLTADQVLNLLRDVPFLQELSCSVIGLLRTETSTHTHSYLETLHCNLHPILALLRLPALRTFRLANAPNRTEDHFIPFLSSCTRLQCLCTDRRIGSMSVDWFTAMPGLRDIDLFDPAEPFLSDFLDRLDRTNNSAFLPHLRTIAFRNCTFDLDLSVPEAISSRCTENDSENMATLESFQQTFKLPSHPDGSFLDHFDIAGCRDAVEWGMTVDTKSWVQSLSWPAPPTNSRDSDTDGFLTLV